MARVRAFSLLAGDETLETDPHPIRKIATPQRHPHVSERPSPSNPGRTTAAATDAWSAYGTCASWKRDPSPRVPAVLFTRIPPPIIHSPNRAHSIPMHRRTVYWDELAKHQGRAGLRDRTAFELLEARLRREQALRDEQAAASASDVPKTER